MAHPLLCYLLHNPRSIVAYSKKGIISYRLQILLFSDLLYYKQAGSSQKGIVIPDGKTVQIEFYRFIPKYFFKLNPIPNNPMSM